MVFFAMLDHSTAGNATICTDNDTTVVDSVLYNQKEVDSVASINLRKDTLSYDETPLGKSINKGFISFFERFSRIDSSYIEPQRYNYAAMIQNTNTYEVYRISNNDHKSITLAPDWTYKVGPYFGWRWIFLGYTLDINHIDFSKDDSQRQELDLSLYTNLFGIDLYWRKSGDDYKIRHLSLGNGTDTKEIEGATFHGFHSSIKGFNFYYILNHHKFSYPAAFSQSTVQRRSAGSVLLGIAYTVHKVSVDWTQLGDLIESRLGEDYSASLADTTYQGFRIKYLDFSLSGGYAYNWVFAKNWLFSCSTSLAIAYKHSYGNENRSIQMRKGFSFHNFGLDGIGRFALVYNNTKWYFGVSSTMNAFNYDKSRFSINTFFGNINFYVGFNFGRKKDS